MAITISSVNLPARRKLEKDPPCRQADQYAFERAQKNMLEYYFLVGITEQFEDMVTLLENLIPFYFNGLTQSWKELG